MKNDCFGRVVLCCFASLLCCLAFLSPSLGVIVHIQNILYFSGLHFIRTHIQLSGDHWVILQGHKRAVYYLYSLVSQFYK